jgi:tetratricopeptide (TPR) repeat protein
MGIWLKKYNDFYREKTIVFMNKEKFDHYFQQTQRLTLLLPKDQSIKEKLNLLIQSNKNSTEHNLEENEFFKGEFYFFNEKYDYALKHYLNAKTVPNYPFFCFRASAYISFARMDVLKALQFANKALQIYPEDYSTLAILEKIMTHNVKIEEAQKFVEIPKSKEEITISPEKENDKLSSISLGEKGIEELNAIFDCSKNHHELFAEEFAGVASLESQNQREESFSSVAKQPTFSHKNVSNREGSMNPETDIFSSPKPLENRSSVALTRRLYGNDSSFQSIASPKSHCSANDLEEKEAFSKECLQTEYYITNQLQLDLQLEDRIKTFQNLQTDFFQEYLENSKKRAKLFECGLYILQGWDESPNVPSSISKKILLTEQSQKTSGGFYLRWYGKGIVLNPGRRFLKNFHEQGLNIFDIDYVIVTKDDAASYHDAQEIYELNAKLNRLNPEFHVIHYYLSQKSYQDLARSLKPNFKQERNTVHRLELFLDSPDVEKIELCEGITLHYFGASVHEAYTTSEKNMENGNSRSSCLGIRFEFKTPSVKSLSYPVEKCVRKIGYISGSPWSPLLAHHLGSCDVLIAGFGNTSPNDYNKIGYQEDCLGFHGTYSLMDEITPRLLLCCEFNGKEGDIRIEVPKKMRQEFDNSPHSTKEIPVVLPGDQGMFLDLTLLQIECTLSKTLVDPSQIRVVKTADFFGKLQYLAPSCIL